jgi:hypothetical protein
VNEFYSTKWQNPAESLELLGMVDAAGEPFEPYVLYLRGNLQHMQRASRFFEYPIDRSTWNLNIAAVVICRCPIGFVA